MTSESPSNLCIPWPFLEPAQYLCPVDYSCATMFPIEGNSSNAEAKERRTERTEWAPLQSVLPTENGREEVRAVQPSVAVRTKQMDTPDPTIVLYEVLQH